jgi:3-phenylpropionate/trans-cinnamate dioxygenase ferredoxin reductase component
MTKRVVIIGTGHGGIQVAISLRESGFSGSITLISDEADLPYQKPPLSKGFLNGKQTVDNLRFRNPSFYVENDIELILNQLVTHIDLQHKIVATANNQTFSYDNLVFATGARNRKWAIEGSNHEKVLYLRHLGDAQQLQSAMVAAQKITIIGGGFIGLEIAAVAVEWGKKVTVIEAQARLMNRVLPPILSDIFLQKHQEQGVDIRLNAQVSKIGSAPNRAINGVQLIDNQYIESDLVVIGIGVLPNEELAKSAGLSCNNGIEVNEFLQTTEDSVYAIGDCARYWNAFAGQKMRVESVQNAVDQAKCVAKNIMGERIAYHAVPWFWTNQYDLKLQMAGINLDFDQYVVRGDVSKHKCSIFYYKNQKFIGADSLNRPADHLAARRLLQAGVSPTLEQVENIAFKL